jgi:hypothetical protein
VSERARDLLVVVALAIACGLLVRVFFFTH